MLDTNSLLGTPYRKSGWSLEAGGLDCWGLVLEVYRLLGGRFASFRDDFMERLSGLEEAVLWNTLPRQFDKVACPGKPGDLLLMDDRKEPSHILVYLARNHIMHCNRRLGPHVVRWRDVAPRVTCVLRLKQP